MATISSKDENIGKFSDLPLEAKITWSLSWSSLLYSLQTALSGTGGSVALGVSVMAWSWLAGITHRLQNENLRKNASIQAPIIVSIFSASFLALSSSKFRNNTANAHGSNDVATSSVALSKHSPVSAASPSKISPLKPSLLKAFIGSRSGALIFSLVHLSCVPILAWRSYQIHTQLPSSYESFDSVYFDIPHVKTIQDDDDQMILVLITSFFFALGVWSQPLVPPGTCYFSPQLPPLVLSLDYSCPKPFYCPNATIVDQNSLPQMCTPSGLCQVQRLTARRCNVSQGDYEPVICPPGYYCPTYLTIEKCPAGYNCPVGSTEPLKCNQLSICAAGATFEFYYGGFMFCIIADAVILIAYFTARCLNKSFMKSEKLRLDVIEMTPSSNPESLPASKLPIELTSSSLKEKEKAKSTLMQFYRKAFTNESGQKPKLDFSFKDMGMTLPDGTSILDGVSGNITAGRLVAIMGPSGAGKTTFMNVLMGKVQRTTGSLHINDEETEMSSLKRIIGFVPQEDIMLRELTVLENIYHSARVRLPRSWSNKEVSEFVEAVIVTLGLEGVRYNLIGDEMSRGVSGGQRKRVNIAMAMAAAPLALFLDEPTSGLDATASLNVADILKEICSLGVNVISVLHQPRFEIFEKFDDILVIAKGGRTAYLGEQGKIIDYFKDLGYYFHPLHNPADVLMDIVSGNSPMQNEKAMPLSAKELADKWSSKETTDQKVASDLKDSSIKQDAMLLPHATDDHNQLSPNTNQIRSSMRSSIRSLSTMTQGRRYATIWYQAWLCHNRNLVQQYRRINSLALELFVAFLAGALMGLSVNGNKGELYQGLYVMPMTPLSSSTIEWLIPLMGMLIHVSAGLSGAPAGVKIFGEEKTVYWREAAAGHSQLGYYVGKSVSALYRLLLASLHFTGIFYMLATPRTSFSDIFLVIFCDYFCIYGLSAIVSMLVRRENASLLAVVVCLFTGVFCGFGPSLTEARDWGIVFIWYLSYGSWGSEALYAAELRTYTAFYQTNIGAENFGYNLNQFGFDIGMMIVLGFGYRFVAFILLLLTHRNEQK